MKPLQSRETVDVAQISSGPLSLQANLNKSESDAVLEESSNTPASQFDDLAYHQLVEELRQSEESLRLALLAGNMGTWDWNLATGEVRWSEQLQCLFGLEPGSFAGSFEAFLNLIHPDDRAAVDRESAKVAQGYPYDQEFRILWPDGTLRYMAGKGRLYRNSETDPGRVLGTTTDITERKKEENNRQFLAEASEVLTASLDYDTILKNLSRLIVPRLADWCTIDLADEQQPNRLRALILTHSDPEKEKYIYELKATMMPEQDESNPLVQVLVSGQATFIPRIPAELIEAVSENDPAIRQLLYELGLISAMYVPLVARGRSLGVLSLNTDKESGRELTQDDLALVEELARRAALAADNARLYREAQLARQEAEAASERTRRLQEVTAALSSATTTQQVIGVMMEQGRTAAKASTVSAILYLPETQAYHLVAASVGAATARQWYPSQHPLDEGLPAVQVARTGQPLWMDDLSKAPWTAYPSMQQARTALGRQAYALVPIGTGAIPLGTLALGFDEIHPFNQPEQELLVALATQCAQALERARLYENELANRQAAERSQERLAFLAEASNLLNLSLDYADTLETVVQLAVPRIADWCSLYLLEKDLPQSDYRDELKLVAMAHSDPQRLVASRQLRASYPLRLSDPEPSSVGGVIRSGRPALVSGLTSRKLVEGATPGYYDDYYLETLSNFGLTSSMIVPIQTASVQFGALVFLSDESGSARSFGPADLEMAQELARRAAQALENARLYRDLQEALQDRDEFLSVAAHELKTPLTGLKGFTQLLARQLDRSGTVEPERLRHSLRAITNQSDKLARLVDQLLNLSRIEAGKLKLEKQPAQVNELLENAVAVTRAGLGAAHQLELELPAAPVTAWLDPLRFEQVVNNLLDNAVKYSPDGGIVTVALAVLPEEDCLQLSVTDQGIGIPPERRAHIFERFYQAHNQSYISGMGLGLYISRQIVELHDGQIAAEFPANGGTRFVISLPLGPSLP